MGGFDDLADRLQAVVEELDDRAFERLREAAASGVTARPASDKELTRARRAVEKAVLILRAIEEPADR